MDYTTTLLSKGLVSPIAGGLQIDLNAVHGGSICDHNCTTYLGSYNCPAAFTFNKGIKPKFTQAKHILNWIGNSIEAIRKHNKRFTGSKGEIHEYCYKNRIPVDVRDSIIELLSNNTVEVNLFGGNPEMHPDILDIIRGMQADMDVIINLTTTGRRMMRDPVFAVALADAGVDGLSLSLDDVDIKELRRLVKLPLKRLMDEWKKINPLHGQAQKVIEAIYTLRLFQDTEMGLVVNMVAHPGNYHDFEDILHVVSADLGAEVNPYPFQTWFDGKESDANEGFTGWFGQFIDSAIQYTDSDSHIVPRIHYWLMLKAIYKTFLDTHTRAQYLAGKGWTCYSDPIYPYLQIGGGSKTSEVPGGFPGCYWNPKAVSHYNQANKTETVFKYLNGGLKRASLESLLTSNTCSGCLMPRLTFNMITLESGIDRELKSAYLELRRRHLGF